MDVLQKPTLSDNFFQIGGTSINAVHAVAKINEHFAMPIERFISARTIAELVGEGNIVSEKKGDGSANPNEKADIEVTNLHHSATLLKKNEPFLENV